MDVAGCGGVLGAGRGGCETVAQEIVVLGHIGLSYCAVG